MAERKIDEWVFKDGRVLLTIYEKSPRRFALVLTDNSKFSMEFQAQLVGMYVTRNKANEAAIIYIEQHLSSLKNPVSHEQKKATIRAAGLRTEKKFFGPRGIFAKEGQTSHVKKHNPKKPVPLRYKHLAAIEDVSTRHLLKSAHDTLKRSDGLAGTMGRPTIAEARAILKRHGIAEPNPITVVGNPPVKISANVSGVLYNRVLEVQAEKTQGEHKGLWFHPFEGKSQVQMLALDNGDILLHSKAGKKLWKTD